VDEKGDPASRRCGPQGHTNLISLICRRPTGRYTYSVIRGSPYDDDIFQVDRLTAAFQAAEDRRDIKIWGGSKPGGGLRQRAGQQPAWTRLRDIAEAISPRSLPEGSIRAGCAGLG